MTQQKSTRFITATTKKKKRRREKPFDLKLMSAITSDESSSDSNSNSAASESDEDEDNSQSNKAICGECGKELDTGWKCSACRKECPICNRALSTDPNEYCERCFKFCKYHGLYTRQKDGSFICSQCLLSK
jgi:hypothetical protein